MSLMIYNSLTRKKEEFVPPEKGRIGIYVCGPTVYDEPHIGHARSAYIFDVIVKYLRFKFENENRKIVFVRNVTDIDDKIIDRARREPGQEDLKKKVKNIAEKYLSRYHDDTRLLGLDEPDIEPKATDVINDMITFIQLLIDKEYAYKASGGVYFSVRKFEKYGHLSKQGIEQMVEGVRVMPGENKKDPLDFALWKASKEDEPYWESPWGRGRPGWHIECSAMSTKFLGNDFLIHGGGLDLIFPHHENEIAQTVCAGKKSARYWIHNGLLAINGQKMSKSLGNFISIRDFYSQYRDLDLLKLLFLSSHYRHPVDYTKEKIEDMKRAKERITTFFRKIREAEGAQGSYMEMSQKRSRELERLKRKFDGAMGDDFNTAEGLAAIFDLVALGNICLTEEGIRSAAAIRGAILKLCAIFGISANEPELTLDKEEEGLIRERDTARRDKRFKKADEIRKKLFKKGITLEDTKEGTVWRRKV